MVERALSASSQPPSIHLSTSSTQSPILVEPVAQSSSAPFPSSRLHAPMISEELYTPSHLPKLDAAHLEDAPNSRRDLSESRSLPPEMTPTQSASTLFRQESQSSIGSGSRTANFFASSPVSSPALRPSSGDQGHARTSSATSQHLFSSSHLFPTSVVHLSHSKSTKSSKSIDSSWFTGFDSLESADGRLHRASASQIRPPVYSSGQSMGGGGGGVGARGPGPSIRLPTPVDDSVSILTSTSSSRSGPNWDEFEGRPIVALPSPSVPLESIESGDSMFVNFETLRTSQHYSCTPRNLPTSAIERRHALPTVDAPQSSPFSAHIEPAGSGEAPPVIQSTTNIDHGAWLPSMSSRIPGFSGVNNVDQRSPRGSTASKTSNFFHSSGLASPPLPPPSRKSYSDSPSRSSSISSQHLRTASNQSNTSAFWNTMYGSSSPSASPGAHQTIFPSMPSIASSVSPPTEASPFATSSALPNFQSPSRFPTLQSKNGPVSGIETTLCGDARDSAQRQEHSGKVDAVSVAGVSFSPVTVSSPRVDEIYLGVGLGPPPDFVSSGRPAQRRYIHGPSENPTRSSLVPSATHGNLSFELVARHGANLSGSNVPSFVDLDGGARSLAANAMRASSSSERAAQTSLIAVTPKDITMTDADARSATPATYSKAAGDEVKISIAEESEDEASGRVGRYQVQRTLGVGAFSRVVLAAPLHEAIGKEDVQGDLDDETRCNNLSGPRSTIAVTMPLPLPPPAAMASKKKPSLSSWSKTFRKQPVSIHRGLPSSGIRSKVGTAMTSQSSSSSVLCASETAASSSLSPLPSLPKSLASDRMELPGLVALKMMAREPCEQNERMRVSWVREVEVLKHIRHPSLIAFVHSFSTPKNHVLVLERVAGGELFDLLSNHQGKIFRREWLVRRLFAELANAVGWMHSIHLVHRDIKLENIILTRVLFSTAEAEEDRCKSLKPSALGSIPLLKLSDFGLSRFIDPAKPLLETRCGSEEYASPELIIGKKYDGRKTDVWAMGVVLYALVCGSLPFVETGSTTTTYGREGTLMVERDAKERKAHLLNIAKGDLRWPMAINDESADCPVLSPACNGVESPSLSPSRLVTPFAKHIISRLLRRDATKRCQAWDCFDDPWLTHGSFYRTGGEATAQGEGTTMADAALGLPPSPWTEAGQSWLREHAELKAGEVGTVASHD